VLQFKSLNIASGYVFIKGAAKNNNLIFFNTDICPKNCICKTDENVTSLHDEYNFLFSLTSFVSYDLYKFYSLSCKHLSQSANGWAIDSCLQKFRFVPLFCKQRVGSVCVFAAGACFLVVRLVGKKSKLEQQHDRLAIRL